METLRGKSYFIQPTRFQRSDVILGEGSYGMVYRGTYNHSQYALKYIRRYLFHSPSASTFSMNIFERECEFARQMADPNIVRFVGVSYDEDVPILITELMECSLTDVLNCRYCSIPYYREVNIARGIASGLHYLHTRSTPVVHRDLSSNNILLAEDCTAKIADLGVAKCVGGSAGTPMPGTTVYMPPEVTQPLELSVAVDLFSFGVLLVQIETRRFPEPADKVEKIVRNKQSGEGVVEGEEGEVEGEGRGEEGQGGDQRGVAGEGEAEGKEGSSEQRRESQYERNDSQEKTQVWRTEIERRHSHLCLMDKMGVFHRIAMCYLQESAKVRRQTKLEEVAGWLEEATRAHNYTESVRTNPETPLEHRTANHAALQRRRRDLPAAGAVAASDPLLPHPPPPPPRNSRRPGWWKRLTSRSSGSEDSGYQSLQGHSAPEIGSDWQLVEREVPSEGRGRGVLSGVLYSLGQLYGRLGLAAIDENDSEYKQRVMKSL